MDIEPQEIIVKKSTIVKYSIQIFSIACATLGVYMLLKKEWRGLVAIICGIVTYLINRNDYKKNRPIIKIKPNSIWTNETGWLDFNEIHKVKIKYAYAGKFRLRNLEIFKINKVDPEAIIQIENINITVFKLKRILRERTIVE